MSENFGTMATIILLLLASPLVVFFGNADLAYALKLTSLMLIVISLSKLQEVWLIRRMHFKSLAIRTFIMAAFRVAIKKP